MWIIVFSFQSLLILLHNTDLHIFFQLQCFFLTISLSWRRHQSTSKGARLHFLFIWFDVDMSCITFIVLCWALIPNSSVYIHIKCCFWHIYCFFEMIMIVSCTLVSSCIYKNRPGEAETSSNPVHFFLSISAQWRVEDSQNPSDLCLSHPPTFSGRAGRWCQKKIH